MVLILDERTCPETGVRLVAAAGETGVQVSKTHRNGFSGAPRFAGEPTANWNRWDAPGATLYYAASVECAFAETLAHLRRPPDVPDPFLKSAAHLGVTYPKFLDFVEQDEGEAGFTATGVLPPSWRRSRSIFEVRLPDSGWWVDITHADTLAALDCALGELLEVVDALSGRARCATR